MSLGSNALYISFLRGFSGAMRRVFVGASEGLSGAPGGSDDTMLVGRSRSSDLAFGFSCLAVPFAGAEGRFAGAEGEGSGGFVNPGGCIVGWFVLWAFFGMFGRGGLGLASPASGACFVGPETRTLLSGGPLFDSVRSTT